MSNRGGIDSDIVKYLEADHQVLFTAVKAEFDTETIYLWSGDYDLVISGNTYLGVGTLLSISNIEDTLELKSSGLSVALAGMDATVLDLSLTENYQNRFITVYLGYLSGGTDTVVGTMTLFKGRMQSITINDNPNGSTITVDAENRLIDLSRPSNLRYTKESQQYISPNDTCFNRVQSLQDKEIIWGRSSSNTGTGTGCFVAGTEILMSDNKQKPIEEINVGDEVMTYDIVNKEMISTIVNEISTPLVNKTIQYTGSIKTEDGLLTKTITTTPDHPMYSIDKGWVSYDPSFTKETHKMDDIKPLGIGDRLFIISTGLFMTVDEISLENHEEKVQTYNLVNVGSFSCYFANNILVHNKYDEGRDGKIGSVQQR